MFSSKNPTFISSRRRNCSVQITFSRSAGSDFPSLRTLHLGDNHLPQLPETIGNLRGLMCLSRSRFFFCVFFGWSLAAWNVWDVYNWYTCNSTHFGDIKLRSHVPVVPQEAVAEVSRIGNL